MDHTTKCAMEPKNGLKWSKINQMSHILATNGDGQIVLTSI